MSQPHNTSIKIYSGVPWDDSYTDVRYFEGSVSIPGTLLYSGTNFSYQRVTSSIATPRIAYSARVPKNANELYTANYLEFNNGTKTFYCFVKEVNYVNLNCTEIIYIIDAFTTWFYDCTLNPSYVVREHHQTDLIGENIVHEPMSVTMICKYESLYSTPSAPIRWTVYANAKSDGTYLPGSIINGLYTGASRISFNTLDEVNAFLKEYTDNGHLDAIIGIFNTKAINDNVTISVPTTIDGYTPKNNKLFTYQFNRLLCSSYESGQQEFAFEFFDGAPAFTITTNAIYGGNAMCVPNNYNGTNIDYGVYCNNQLSAAWSGDLSSQYFNYTGVMNGWRILLNGMGGIAGNLLTGNIENAANAAITTGVSTITNVGNAKLESVQLSPSFKGGGVSNTNWAVNKVGFHIDQKCVPAILAKQIDNYFSMYGYATNTTKIPNLTGRTYFNYVKLQSPCITGSVPDYAMKEIKRIFINGVRLWHNNNIGVWNPEGGNPIG